VPQLIASGKSVFDHPKPQLGDGEVLALLRREYGLEGSTEPLVSERDQNFLVDASGREFVLKIANAVEDRGLLALQNEVLEHLARTAPGLGIPRLVRTLTGAEVTEWKSGAAIHAVRLLTYLPGRPFS
jgi:Ser/Thr protein kinase RdoA (MazF antagonist)